MTEFSQLADFIAHYGWLGVTLLIVAVWRFGWFHSDREYQFVVGLYSQAIVQRDAAIKLAQDLTDIIESGRRGQYRGH